MSSIKVIEDEMSIKLNNLDPCIQNLWVEIKDVFESLDVRKAIQQRSESFKSAISLGVEGKPNFRWEKASVFHDPSMLDVAAIYRLDGTISCDGKCGTFHKVNLVLCLNNRESIGTNFLKLETAAQEDIRNHKQNEIFDKNILGILISFNDGLLREGAWDSSYGNAVEYTFAFKHAYRGIIQSNIIGMQLHLI
jgi:hypothetical protein